MTNPLLRIPFAIPFDQVRAEHVGPGIDALIAKTEEALAAIGHTKTFTWDTTIGALEAATEDLEVALTVVGHLESVATTPALREAYNEAQPKASELWSSISLDPKLYASLLKFAETDEAKALAGAKKRLLDKTLDEFRRQGAGLDDDDKNRLQEIDVALTKRTTKFSQNVLDDTNEFELLVTDEAKLKGLPASAIAAAKQSAESKKAEGWRFTLHAPSYIAVMQHLDDASIREQMWRAYNARASGGERDNRALIIEILKLRKEKATLLGYDDFADFVLEPRMAKSGERASAFVADLRTRTQEAFDREKVELHAFRAELEGADAPAIAPWDVGYYAEKLRKSRFAFDDEALRPYFAVDHVLEGLFRLAGALYGVEIRPYEAAAWNEAVRAYGIYEGDVLLAAFYVDLFPREDKRGGAWMNPLISGVPKGSPQLGLFCANVSPPVGDAPAQLTHREVETLFHEFGHLLHHALSEVEVRSLNGTNVAWDFVELPSQIMENFCWERVSLDLFAKHYETGEKIPDELFDKMMAARTFRAASGQMRQLGFASVDLYLHTVLDDLDTLTPESMLETANAVLELHAPAPLPEGYAMICGFSHLFSSPTGYAAAYYSYKWAEVLDADAFTKFAEAGVVDRATGDQFRKTILARGNAAEPDLLYRDFMGRDPELEPLLRRNGLVS
jgi:oligopeptidase A